VIRPPAIDAKAEFARVSLGDRRLNARLDRLVSVLEDAPDRSFPSAMRSDAELEGAYRFFQNERVTLDRLIAPHIEATVKRAELARGVLVVHDTTEFRFEGMKARAGLGSIAGGGQGFFGHFALAISGEDDRAPLGIAGLLTYTRQAPSRRTNQLGRAARREAPRGESSRWSELIDEVQQRMSHLVPIHVMDREADDFVMFSDLVQNHVRFVVRMTAARRRQGTDPTKSDAPAFIEDLIKVAPIVATREVRLSPRAGKRGRTSERVHPVRDCRSTALSIAAMTVDIQPPRPFRNRMTSLELAVIRVVETTPPVGEKPVEWLLVTTEAIDTAEQILRVVDAYRARWVIEEYFKALKTGCAIERRQLESIHSLLAALGIFAPLAVRLLALRTYARSNPDAPATKVLSEHELLALRAIGRTQLPPVPNVRDALYALAALGGHLKRNGEPGWIVLARGLEKLEVAAQVVAVIAGRSRDL